MAKVLSPSGTFYKQTSPTGNRTAIESLADALMEIAKCDPCGCDPCLGLWTQINAETGDLMGVYITGDGTEGNEFALVVEPLDDAVTNTKALKATRDSE